MRTGQQNTALAALARQLQDRWDITGEIRAHHERPRSGSWDDITWIARSDSRIAIGDLDIYGHGSYVVYDTSIVHEGYSGECRCGWCRHDSSD